MMFVVRSVRYARLGPSAAPSALLQFLAKVCRGVGVVARKRAA